MSATLSEFQKLLQKTQKEMSLRPKQVPKPENEKKSLEKFQKLPTEINIPKTLQSLDCSLFDKETAEKPKKKSFKELMKMAKNVKLEGLLKKTQLPTLPAQSVKYKIVDPIHKMIPPKSNNLSLPIHKMIQPKNNLHSLSKKVKRYVPSELIKLNTNKRDLATTEEIHDELLQRKGIVKHGIFKDSRTIQSASKHDRFSPSPLKTPRPQPSESSGRKRYPDNNYSTVIQDIFGRGRKRVYDDQSDDSSDMEANYADIHKEEQRSLKIGKKEDEITELELQAKAEAKKKKQCDLDNTMVGTNRSWAFQRIMKGVSDTESLPTSPSLFLVKEAFRTRELPNIPQYHDNAVKNTIAEINSLYKQSSSKSNEASKVMKKAYLERSKRCVLAYQRHRIERYKDLLWSCGANTSSILPEESRKSASTYESKFIEDYKELVTAWKGQYLDIDIGSSKTPPKDVFIEIRVVEDCGEIMTDSGPLNLNEGTQHFIKRVDVEDLILSGRVVHIT